MTEKIALLISPAMDVRSPFSKQLVAALAQIVADEREACARLARPMCMPCRGTPYGDGANDTAEMIETAIRSRR